MSNISLGTIGFSLSLVTLLGGGAMYANTHNKLSDTTTQLRNVEQERENLNNQIQEKDEEIQRLNGIIKGNDNELERKLGEIE